MESVLRGPSLSSYASHPAAAPALEIELEWQPPGLERRLVQATWVFVALGLIARAVRYLLRFPLWGDEAAMAANFLDRGYFDLFRPLDFQQVASPLFMAIELSAVKLFGFNEYSLRAFPFACSLASVILFRHVAARLLGRLPLVLAVAVFGVSYYPLRHCAEVKPYASDLFVALALVALAIEWRRRPVERRWLWCLALAGPVALTLSHPAAFVTGGISLSLLPLVWRQRSQSIWAPFALFNVGLLAAFAIVFFVSSGPQLAAARHEGIMQAYWKEAFPPVTRPLELPMWFLATHTGQLFAYPMGGADQGSGAVTFLCFVVGAIFLLRQQRGAVIGLCLAPFALTFVAAAMQRYPYGGYARASQHLAPAICLLAGLGIARLIWHLRRSRAQRAAILTCLSLMALLASGLIARDLVHPYRTEHDQRVREFARWFWSDKAIDAELVCACTDLKRDFFRKTYLWRGIAQYLCNQRIYSPRHARGAMPPDWNSVSAARPLRCVIFSRPGLSRNEMAFSHWLADTRNHFEWVGYERNDFYKPHRHGPDIERIEVYEFVPRAAREELN